MVVCRPTTSRLARNAADARTLQARGGTEMLTCNASFCVRRAFVIDAKERCLAGPLYLRKRTFSGDSAMSALCQQATSLLSSHYSR
jgi:hypothetical protein